MNALEGAPPPGLVRRFGATAIVLIFGLGASTAMFLLLRSAEIDGAQQQFASWTAERRDLLQKEVDAHLQVLEGVRALFDSSEYVSAREFADYTAPFLDRYPHMYSLSWLPRVPGNARADFERSAGAQLGIDYRIRDRTDDGVLQTAPDREAYWPILYTQARDGLVRAGVDSHQRPENSAAMAAAAQTHEPSASLLEVSLPGDPPLQRLFVYLAVMGTNPQGAPEVLGYVRTTLSIEDLLQSTFHDAAKIGIAVQLIDPRAGGVLDSVTPVSDRRQWSLDILNPTVLRWSGEIDAADRSLVVEFESTSSYVGHPLMAPLWALFAAGVLVSAFGATAVLHLTRRRLDLQRLTRELLVEVRERRHSEMLLSASEERYRVLVENSPDAIILNKDGVITFANKACARLLGIEAPEELIGKAVFDVVHPDYHEQVRNGLSTMTQTHIVLPPVEQRLVRSDGSTVDVEVLSMPFDTEAGVTVQATLRDITRRKAIEAERLTLEAALRQAQKLEAVGTLAGGIAHDFNNILTAVLGNARLLLEDLPESHPGWRSAREIRTAAQRARELVKRLMAFSRQQESQRAPVPVAPLLREVQQLLRATLPAGVELIMRVAPDTPPILGDPTQMHQVLVNLCTNAWQAMPGNTGRIDVGVRALAENDARAQSGAPLQAAARYVHISVCDDGVGMTEDTLEHMFEPFFTTKQPGEGSGLGLAVVHGIVQSHGGAVTVTSRVGEGSTFNIFLPAAQSQAAQVGAGQRSGARGAAQHVLYLDDEEPLVFLARRTLERAGFRCTGELSAERAIELVAQSPKSFDLVITDLNMPGMSGLDVARELLAIRPDLPIVITTGYVRADDVAAARKLGVRDVILKPDTIDELPALVQRQLERRMASGES